MRIVVLVKEVPDTYGERRIDLETGLVDRGANDKVADEIGERAVEAALTLAESLPDTTVTTLAMGPSSATDAIRKTLSMGADAGVLVTDDRLAGADLTLTAEVLAGAVRDLSADLVVLGDASTDGNGGVMGAMLAEHLGAAQLTNLADWTSDGTTVEGTRVVDGVQFSVSAALPAVVSVTEAFPDPRYPNFKGIMAAKRKTITERDATGLTPDLAGESTPRAIVVAASQSPSRAAGTKIVDEGDAGLQLARFLIDRKLV